MYTNNPAWGVNLPTSQQIAVTSEMKRLKENYFASFGDTISMIFSTEHSKNKNDWELLNKVGTNSKMIQ